VAFLLDFRERLSIAAFTRVDLIFGNHFNKREFQSLSLKLELWHEDLHDLLGVVEQLRVI
jgi:hypothetical protein